MISYFEGDSLFRILKSRINSTIATIAIIKRVKISHISIIGVELTFERLKLIKIPMGMANIKDTAPANSFLTFSNLNNAKTPHRNTIERIDILMPMGKIKLLVLTR